MYGSGHGNRDQQLYNPHGFIEIVNEIERHDTTDHSAQHIERSYGRSERENHYRFCGEEDSYTAGHEQYVTGAGEEYSPVPRRGDEYSMFGGHSDNSHYENLKNYTPEYRTG